LCTTDQHIDDAVLIRISTEILASDCGSVSQSLSDDFHVSVEAWHLLNTHVDYKNG